MDFYSAAAGNELGTFALRPGDRRRGGRTGRRQCWASAAGIVMVPSALSCAGLLGVDADVRVQQAVGTSLATIIPPRFRRCDRTTARRRGLGALETLGGADGDRGSDRKPRFV